MADGQPRELAEHGGNIRNTSRTTGAAKETPSILTPDAAALHLTDAHVVRMVKNENGVHCPYPARRFWREECNN